MAKQSEAEFDYLGQWDGPAGVEELELPSGKKILVRPASLAVMAKRGVIPNHILPVIERFVAGGMRMLLKEIPELADPAIKPGESLVRKGDLEDYIDTVCVASAHQPRISFDGAPGTLKVDWLDAADRFAIWDWGVGLTRALAAFRGNGAGAVEPAGSLPGGEGLRDAAEQPAGADAA